MTRMDGSDCMKTVDKVPPSSKEQLLPLSTVPMQYVSNPSPALTSSPMPEYRPTYVLTLRYGRVRLTTSGCLRRWCMRLSMWFYKMAGY